MGLVGWKQDIEYTRRLGSSDVSNLYDSCLYNNALNKYVSIVNEDGTFTYNENPDMARGMSYKEAYTLKNKNSIMKIKAYPVSKIN